MALDINNYKGYLTVDEFHEITNNTLKDKNITFVDISRASYTLDNSFNWIDPKEDITQELEFPKKDNKIPIEIKMAVCEMIKSSISSTEKVGIKKEKIGSFEVEYSESENNNTKLDLNLITKLVKKYVKSSFDFYGT